MKPLQLLLILLLLGGFVFGQGQNFPGGSNSSGNGASPACGQNPCPVPSGLVQTGLMAEFRMNEGSGLVINDSSGNNLVGTFGTTTFAPTWNTVANGGGVIFSGGQVISLPASLNAAKTIILYISYQPSSNANQYNCPIGGNNSPSTSYNLCIQTGVSALVDVSHYEAVTGAGRVVVAASSALQSINKASFAGTQFLAVALDATNDVFYLGANDKPGKTEIAANGTTQYLIGSGIGKQSAGQYLLGGSGAGQGAAVQTFFTGTIYYAAFYSIELTPAQIAQDALVVQDILSNRGITTFVGATDSNDQLIADGDSITSGYAAASTVTPYTATPFSAGLTGTWQISNQGRASERLSNMVTNADQAIDTYYRIGAGRNVVFVWGGTNDLALDSITAANTFARLRNYCIARRAVGWKCIPITMVSRTSNDTNKNNYNALIRQHWAEFADALADIASDPNLGADGASASATFFQADNVHPSQNAIYNDEMPVMKRAVSRLYGNRDFSSATVYGSAAAAAVATTAGSETTNTVTITFTATPANCQVGNTITIAGTTPAGYSGNFTILTRSTTQVTYFTGSGLGAISIQGTGVCPQQQDADTYSVLNFGTGNFTLESCVGYTGQNIYIKNINGSSSTVVPFGAETIDGASTLTVATKATAILQSALTSASAAGCSWKQIQNN